MKGWSIFREGKDHFFWVRRLSLTLFCMGYFYLDSVWGPLLRKYGFHLSPKAKIYVTQSLPYELSENVRKIFSDVIVTSYFNKAFLTKFNTPNTKLDKGVKSWQPWHFHDRMNETRGVLQLAGVLGGCCKPPPPQWDPGAELRKCLNFRWRRCSDIIFGCWFSFLVVE